MTFVDVGAEADFVDGSITTVSIDGIEVGVARWGGRMYAIRNVCPHQAAPVATGMLHARLGSPHVGAVAVEPPDPVIACPWHGWEFDTRTGRCISDARMRLRCYSVRARDGRVQVDIEGRGR